ncbi:TPA: nucleotide exchange factor GrpE [candidate division WWE3 bacterium]|uniref:Protein GrpE n=2 Tax=Katanobacteria TaxID=422282 RepID=A0A1F4V6W6_UNCKA|nr:MAG: nucleotide exchange factor GrpE [candidate division WWE3 bacterium RIFCSPHIGHO2_01_FULL_43_9]HAZ29747.1 nucleotide exchange factor GrpE [candidate division WWE3 bacterium]
MDQTTDDKSQIENLHKRIEELENNWKRALADYKNLERRTAEEKEEFAQFASMLLIQRLLPIVDNLQLLEKHVNDSGLKMIVKEFLELLEENGVKQLETDGKDYDSATMECVDTLDCEDTNKGKVVETTARGYKLKNKILRPAKVKVGKS